MHDRKIYYILPCYNEEFNIKKLLEDLFNFYKKKKYYVYIVIIDDGSKDNSLKILKKIKKQKLSKKIKIILLEHKTNLGLGYALKDGFRYCFSKGKANDIIISMDCDNSHPIKLSYKMALEIIKNKKDFIIASRYRKNSKVKGLDNKRIFLSYIAAILYKFFFPIKNVKDYTSGFRAIKLGVIKKAYINNKHFFSEKGFSASADIILKLYKYKKYIIFDELPIDLRYDLKNGQSKMKILKTIYLNLKLIFIRRFFN
jgi:dolichol-phosphate mannosyltransferase